MLQDAHEVMAEEVKLLRGEIESWRERLHQREKEEEMEPSVATRERRGVRPARAQSDPRKQWPGKDEQVNKNPCSCLKQRKRHCSP